MKLNLIFLSVVLVMQYEWLGVNCGCENIDSLEQCGKHNKPCYQNDFGNAPIPETFKPLNFDVCPSFFLFKDGKEIKRVSHTLEPKTYEHIDSLCAYKV
ncbi:uncharacterized protein LOC111056440 isoform X2 [Nilaparvata lugens]|uniref:uncharacterized protein LOC111056440 isoform X2 n=1 Tax=Nilaparvata lugens TaxID=108931 RepID=UPI00193D78D5|nr:uncharacterized protein LOC111056440 isoform X2 [Nilaparvata lugens]